MDKKSSKTKSFTLKLDEKFTGPEPTWDTEAARSYDTKTFDHHLNRSFYYYNYHYTVSKLRGQLEDYLRRHSKLDKTVLQKFESCPDKFLVMTSCSLIMAHKKGMPLLEKHTKYIDTQVQNSLALWAKSSDWQSHTLSPGSVVAAKLTIQDRLQEKTSDLIGELEGIFDQVCKKTVVDFNMFDFLSQHKVPQSQLLKFESVFTGRMQEFIMAQDKKDEQLSLGYSNYKPRDFKRVIAFLADLLSGIQQYRGVKKAVKKARIKKAPSKEKLVSKVKYCRQDNELKMVSVNPVSIIGSKELWVYNSKTRKLGKYVAEHLGSLGIKGTSIVGFDTKQSVAKTLRQPLEQLQTFMKCGKIALRTFLKDIRAVEITLNGRLSEDVLLLKVS